MCLSRSGYSVTQHVLSVVQLIPGHVREYGGRERDGFQKEKPGILSSSSPPWFFFCLSLSLSALTFCSVPFYLMYQRRLLFPWCTRRIVINMTAEENRQRRVSVSIYLAVAGCNEFKRVARIVNLFSQLARGACRDGGYVGRDYRKSISFFPSFLWAATGSTHLALLFRNARPLRDYSWR